MEHDPPPITDAVGEGEPVADPVRRSRWSRRSARDRYLGGVAGGIANSFAIDPFIARAAFLGATLFAAYAAGWVPVIPVAYGLLWLVMPSASGPSVLRSIGAAESRREAVAAVASIGVIALLLTRPVFGFALGLAAVAWVLLADRPAPDAPAGLAESTPESGSLQVTSPASHIGEGQGSGEQVFGSVSGQEKSRSRWGRSRRIERGESLVSPFVAKQPRPRRQPALWPLTLGLLVILAILGAMADAFMDPGVDPALLVNCALIIVGGVLVLSAWKGRALLTVLIAVALLPAWVAFSVADIGRVGGSGSASHVPRSIPESGTLSYSNGYGSMTIDLRQIDFAEGEDLVLDIEATAGSVMVLVPGAVDTQVRSKIGLGTATVRGHGLNYFEYDREPFMDRTMVRFYGAQGQGCIDDYWAVWSEVVANHRQAGVDLSGLSVDIDGDVAAVLEAIDEAGFDPPVLVSVDREDFGYYPGDEPQLAPARPVQVVPAPGQAVEVPPQGSYRVIDERGVEYYVENAPMPIEVQQQIDAAQTPFEQLARDRTWSYSSDPFGAPCVAVPAPVDPATIQINTTIGLGTLEINRDEY